MFGDPSWYATGDGEVRRGGAPGGARLVLFLGLIQPEQAADKAWSASDPSQPQPTPA
jgi:hypothetical protein